MSSDSASVCGNLLVSLFSSLPRSQKCAVDFSICQDVFLAVPRARPRIWMCGDWTILHSESGFPSRLGWRGHCPGSSFVCGLTGDSSVQDGQSVSFHQHRNHLQKQTKNTKHVIIKSISFYNPLGSSSHVTRDPEHYILQMQNVNVRETYGCFMSCKKPIDSLNDKVPITWLLYINWRGGGANMPLYGGTNSQWWWIVPSPLAPQ